MHQQLECFTSLVISTNCICLQNCIGLSYMNPLFFLLLGNIYLFYTWPPGFLFLSYISQDFVKAGWFSWIFLHMICVFLTTFYTYQVFSAALFVMSIFLALETPQGIGEVLFDPLSHKFLVLLGLKVYEILKYMYILEFIDCHFLCLFFYSWWPLACIYFLWCNQG